MSCRDGARPVFGYPRTMFKCERVGHGFGRAVRSRNGFRLYSLLKNSDFDFVLKGRGFSHAVSTRKSMRLYRLLKNSDFDFVLKGRGFSRAVSSRKSMQLLAAEGACIAHREFFSTV